MHLALAARDVHTASVALEVLPEPGTVQAGNEEPDSAIHGSKRIFAMFFI